MKVLVVDDEAPARRRLVRQLAELGWIDVVGEAEDGLDALDKVRALAPDLLLLDVRMPGLDGMSLAARERSLPPIVFVTAHEQFAVRAFELEAIDYLLKPVRPDRLARALERARLRAFRHAEPLPAPHVAPRVVTLERGTLRYFETSAITRFWSADKYTLFRSLDGEHVTAESLSELATRLGPHGFLRVHRGELVNTARVRALHGEGGSHCVELDDGQRARVSRREISALRSALERLRAG